MVTVNDLRLALLDARKRTGDNSLSTALFKGKIQLCRVTYVKSISKQENIGNPVFADEAINMLKAM